MNDLADSARRRHEQDTRSPQELVKAYLCDPDSHEAWYAVATLHFRGGQTEFDLAAELTQGPHAERRALGAHILGQLGVTEPTFVDESVDILLGLLDDESDDVVYATCVALGFRNEPRSIQPLLGLIHHANALVRWGVVSGLSGYEDENAIDGLIRLSGDENASVRDWATFGLGSQTCWDTPQLREALVSRIDDEDEMVRGEALVGLAARRDPRTVGFLQRELAGNVITGIALEAAASLADPALYPLLQELEEADNDSPIRNELRNALVACRPLDID
ncbi:MAG: HEAT repeat domain-containing protein [Acidobacteria bacterium]|nr:HEAT repeat domain-containing protein [Acidobacteriota bacterium]